ncbi:rhodanese-like domain-containing protein [Aurantimonas sp. VKM B-3413]|uniref:rhodanese-like domain-containing protein n=1 Tax=Aurantimonas sp. VKM B-3413 TaxID=2779401 RepID=UPI001E58B924|nr:rhodanese-like domain-containing protein [Aurantimonas sp. VKM B-3413]MCB8839771.1 sulfurtransferase [Aurantimonas sp. VKM B-3413]
MTKTMKDFVAAAKEKTGGAISPTDANGLLLDVREAHELADDGRVSGALHVPRGFLEAKADLTNEGGEKALHAAHAEGRPVHVLCASGARASLAAATLTEMGYTARSIEGGLKGWREAGRPVEGGEGEGR